MKGAKDIAHNDVWLSQEFFQPWMFRIHAAVFFRQQNPDTAHDFVGGIASKLHRGPCL